MGQKSENKKSYVGAPYNFVPFTSDPIEIDEAQMKVHDRIEDQMLTGEIQYRIEAKTPILVSDGNKDRECFTRDERGNIVLPGSTMRGLIRSNVQILGLSDVHDDIEDYYLMYRHVASGAEKDNYNKLLDSKQITVGAGKQMGALINVCGGYIRQEKGKYIIHPAVEHYAGESKEGKEDKKRKQYMSYYVLNERLILQDIKKSYPFFLKNGNDKYLSRKLDCKFYRYVKKNKKGKETVHYINDEKYNNNSYSPYYVEVSYEVKGNAVTKLDEPGICSKRGYLVGTGPMDEKKALYIIPVKDMAKEEFEIPKEDLRNFQIDFNKRKNTLKETEGQRKGGEAAYALPKEGEERPVFYIAGVDAHIYFGFTPRLRVFYKYAIREGYKARKTRYDYAKSLFGTVQDKEDPERKAYKSKVSFTDARLISEEKELEPIHIIQGEPKPTSYMDYLQQPKNVYINGKNKNELNTYNDEKFELRGIKQYWLHKEGNTLVNYENGISNENVAEAICPLEAGSRFEGKVRFQNLTCAELGLLLWALRLEKDCCMNVGKAKAYGCGVIQIQNICCRVLDYQQAYTLDGSFETNPWSIKEIDPYIEEYKDMLREKNIDLEKNDTLKTFFVMKKEILENYKIRYMTLDEYENRLSLPTVGEITSIDIPGEHRWREKKEKTDSDKPKSSPTPKVEYQEGKEYEGVIMRHIDGSNIQVKIQKDYKKVRVKKVIIDGQEVVKSNMKDLLPVGTSCKLKYEENKMKFISKK